MKRSTVPGVCDRLTELWTGVVDDLDVGENIQLAPSQNVLLIAWEDDDELPSINGTRGRASFAAGDDTEVYDVLCLLSCWTGDVDIKGTRQTLIDALDVLDDVLAADHTLGGLVAGARVTDFAFAQPITDAGSTATLRFTVHIEAWRH